jgi:hypothetical protein
MSVGGKSVLGEAGGRRNRREGNSASREGKSAGGGEDVSKRNFSWRNVIDGNVSVGECHWVEC